MNIHLLHDMDKVRMWHDHWTGEWSDESNHLIHKYIEKKKTAPPLLLNNDSLDEVSSFIYYGVLPSSDMSCLPHISAICSKACMTRWLASYTQCRAWIPLSIFTSHWSGRILSMHAPFGLHQVTRIIIYWFTWGSTEFFLKNGHTQLELKLPGTLVTCGPANPGK